MLQNKSESIAIYYFISSWLKQLFAYIPFFILLRNEYKEVIMKSNFVLRIHSCEVRIKNPLYKRNIRLQGQQKV